MTQQQTVPRRPTLLIIMDGVGVNPSHKHNALAIANTPNLDRYFASYPHTLLQASGAAVGLPDGQMGNSEVGHLTIGSGTIIRQDLVMIDEAIQDGSFLKNDALNNAMQNVTDKNSKLHLIGLASNGGVHSHTRHLCALLDLCHRHQISPLVHLIADGRDVPPKAFIETVDVIQESLARSGGKIATVTGRYYAMDRDHRWDRTELAFNAIIRGQGKQIDDIKEAIVECYANNETDEFISPLITPFFDPLEKDDQVIFFNFRRDRPRQLVSALFKKDFEEFDRADFSPVSVTTMTEYDGWYKLPFAFTQDRPKNTLAETVSHAGLTQFHCAETEKYAHVTFFLNGGRGDLFPGEKHQIIDSPDVATYDLKPEMSAEKVADTVIEAISSDGYPLIVVNFANGDMVGHTAVREAVIKAVEALDKEVGRVLDAAVEHGYSVILTADHGNCDEMVDPVTGEPHTQHTVYPVPCLVIDETHWQLSIGAGLPNIAPTVLQLMGLPQPEGMSHRSILLCPA
jgi:2,3-bisphosphoglycerate-independent phosphoglycerate mutase